MRRLGAINCSGRGDESLLFFKSLGLVASPTTDRPLKPSLPQSELTELLTAVALGDLAVGEAIERLISTPLSPAPLDQVTLDLDRARRCGFPEVIYGAGKPAKMIIEIMRRQRAAQQPSFATRVPPDVAAEVQSEINSARYNTLAKTLSLTADPESLPTSLDDDKMDSVDHVALITAGSTDGPVAEEAAETLHWMKIAFRRYDDIGVAGPARLLAAVPMIRKAACAIVIAGMEGALPAAVGGHLSVPVFAVPTSVGYGATLGGLTPLMGMLSSCASNVAVVNIDAGFKAAYLAGLVCSKAS